MTNIFLYFLYLHCTSSACSHCTEYYGSFTLVIFESFLDFTLLLTKKEIWETYRSLFGVVTHDSGVHRRLNAFKLTGVVYCNRTSLIFLVNDAKYIHPLLLIFSRPLLLQVWVIHKFIFILFVSLQLLVKLFACNRKIGIVCYFFNKHIKIFFEVVCLHVHIEIACIAWINMKSCSKVLLIPVTAMHFTDRKWISKTV